MGLLGALLDNPPLLYSLFAVAVLLLQVRFGPRGGVAGAALVAAYVWLVPSREQLFIWEIDRVFVGQPKELNSYSEMRRELSDEQGEVLRVVCAVFRSNGFFAHYRHHLLAVAAAPTVWHAVDDARHPAPLWHPDVWRLWMKIKRKRFDQVCSGFPHSDVAEAAHMALDDAAVTDLSEALYLLTEGENSGVALADAFRGAAALGDIGNDAARPRVFLDIGSGRGKVVAVACVIMDPSVRFEQCRGIEISEQRVLAAREFVRRTSLPADTKRRIDMRTLDATDERHAAAVYGNVTMLYIYNTVFDELDTVFARLAATHLQRGARVVIHEYRRAWRDEAHRLKLVGTVACDLKYYDSLFVLQKK